MMAAVMMMRAVMKQEMDRFIVFLHLGMCTYNRYGYKYYFSVLAMTVTSSSSSMSQVSRSTHCGPSQLRLCRRLWYSDSRIIQHIDVSRRKE